MLQKLLKTTRRTILVTLGAANNVLRRWNFPVTSRQTETTELENMSDVEPTHLTTFETLGDRPIQTVDDGVGALFHRRYWVNIADSKRSAEALMTQIKRDPNVFVPQEIAHFKRTLGDADNLQVGDEFYITITSPWDAPVRVIDVTPTSFTFVTLDGHLEAGEITFRIVDHPLQKEQIRFEIVSWARSRDRLVQLAFETLGVGQIAQTGMWTFFCQRVVDQSGGKRIGTVQVATQKVQTNGGIGDG